ncbi:MAG: hypothetical protein GDA38_16165 [Hormoscilla sp. SP12CHS1]|nr:hypothetical protein [Hormoscilla sp. SP12CHS1]
MKKQCFFIKIIDLESLLESSSALGATASNLEQNPIDSVPLESDDIDDELL